MEALTLGLFCGSLICCILLKWNLLPALAFGLGLFWLYGLKKGFSVKALGKMTLQGVKTVKNILLTFLLIGMLTALWRAAGTIPVIVSYACRLIKPGIFLPMTFLLNCLLSVLTGTSFGTAATMGVICATMGQALGMDPRFTGGAILAGAFFGDRCSPVSTSALLTATVTDTDIYRNIRNMIRTAVVPTLASCLIYTLLGLSQGREGTVPDLGAIFGRVFRLSLWAVLPAAVVLGLALCRLSVKKAMTASVLAAAAVWLLVQGGDVRTLPALLWQGYSCSDDAAAAMLNGGGIRSMLKVGMIVCISSSYSGIFKETGLLEGVKRLVAVLADRIGSFGALLLSSAAASCIACNQTLSILLSRELFGNLEPDKERLALDLEDSAVLVAALVPWSIACATPLTTVGCPLSGALFAVYLYLQPLWRLLRGNQYPKREPKG